jgi:uncharacterized protein (DUF4415 family)
MNEKNTKKQSLTDWVRLSTMPDTDIDLSDIAQLDTAFFARATLRMPQPKKAVSLRIDRDVLDWYKKQGAGYQTRMGSVLRLYMQAKSTPQLKSRVRKHEHFTMRKKQVSE